MNAPTFIKEEGNVWNNIHETWLKFERIATV